MSKPRKYLPIDDKGMVLMSDVMAILPIKETDGEGNTLLSAIYLRNSNLIIKTRKSTHTLVKNFKNYLKSTEKQEKAV